MTCIPGLKASELWHFEEHHVLGFDSICCEQTARFRRLEEIIVGADHDGVVRVERQGTGIVVVGGVLGFQNLDFGNFDAVFMSELVDPAAFPME